MSCGRKQQNKACYRLDMSHGLPTGEPLADLRAAYPDIPLSERSEVLSADEFARLARKVDEYPFEGAALAVVLIDDQVLLAHRSGALPGWSLPSGRVEIGEPFTEAIVRELEEETGIEAKVTRLLQLERAHYSAPCSSRKISLVLATFQAENRGETRPRQTAGADAEGLDIRLFSLTELPTMILADEGKLRLALD